MLFSILIVLMSPILGASRLVPPRGAGSRANPGRYIIKLRNDIGISATNQFKASLANTPSHDYNMAGFHGFAGTLTLEEIERLEASHEVRPTKRISCLLVYLT